MLIKTTIFEKIKGIIQLMRFDLSFVAGICVIWGNLLQLADFLL